MIVHDHALGSDTPEEAQEAAREAERERVAALQREHESCGALNGILSLVMCRRGHALR